MTTQQDSAPERIAVVTGGAGAIGTAITQALRDTGHRTVVLDRDGDIACDLGSEASTGPRRPRCSGDTGAAMCSCIAPRHLTR